MIRQPVPSSRLQLLSLAALCLALAACPASPGGEGPAEPGASAVAGPAEGSLPCPGEDVVDVWAFAGSGDVVVTVDTVAAETAFDPGLWLLNVVDDPPSDVAEGDDEFDCTFPPPTYTCPEASGTVSGAMPGVYVFTYDDCVGSVGEYELSVTVDGAPVALTLARDDHETGS